MDSLQTFLLIFQEAPVAGKGTLIAAGKIVHNMSCTHLKNSSVQRPVAFTLIQCLATEWSCY